MEKTKADIETRPPFIRVYRPDSRTEEGFVQALRHLTQEIWSFRWHILTVFRQDFRKSYYGSKLGAFWNVILPLVPLTVFLFLSLIRVFPKFENVDSVTYITFGVTLWFLLAGFLQIPIRLVQARHQEVMKTAFPLSAAILSSFTQLIFDTCMRILFVIAVIVATANWPVWGALFLPLVLFPAFLLFFGAGLLLGILNVIYNDISRIVTIALQYGIFISGVIFPLRGFPLLETLNQFNPFATFIDASRDVVFGGEINNITVFLVTALAGLVLFLLAARLFYVMEYKVRDIH